jgi:hypothetical protein
VAVQTDLSDIKVFDHGFSFLPATSSNGREMVAVRAVARMPKSAVCTVEEYTGIKPANGSEKSRKICV